MQLLGKAAPKEGFKNAAFRKSRAKSSYKDL
jgi:hypothetical protein